mgnify:FL=1
MTLEEWWNLTPREARVYFRAFRKKMEREFKARDTENFILGKYIMMAFNNPKKYPKQPVSQEVDKEQDNIQDSMTEADEARLNALFGSFAAKSNKLTSTSEKPQEEGPEEATAQL